MGIFDFCITRKRSVIFAMILVVLSGIYSYIKIPKEGNPEVKIPLIYVMVSQKGISPEDARKMILQPLETGLQGLEDVKEVTSYAYDGGVSIKIEFDAGVDPDKSLDDVRNKVNDTKPKLPRDSDQPIVKQVDLSLLPVINVVLTADLSKRELLAVARNARDIIMKIPFVRDVNIAGSIDEAVQIIIKPEMIERYAISTDYLKKIISSNNLLVTAGTIQKKDGEFAIKIPGLIDKYDELMEFPVYNSNGKVLKLKDVATVVRDFKDVNIITRANGQNSVVLEVSKRSGQNVIDTVAATKFVIEEAKKYWPKEISVVFANDTSNKIIDMVHELENGILFAALLVMIIIIMSVGIKSAILIALSLPVSFFGCILIMDICGYSLNIVVLFSLILTVGMVVDDAIVVTEYADRKLIEGKSSEDSYLEATKRMFVPIFTATLVKIIVFLPFLFWPGTLGQFMKYMPITVLIIMTNSLVFALLLQPAIGSILMRNHPPVSEKEFKAITAAETGELSDIKGFIGKYIILLEGFMAKPRKFVWSTVGLMVVTFIIFGKFSVGVEFFPKIEPDNATVIVRSTGNTSIWEKNAILKEVEQEMFKFKDSIKVFYTKVGLVDSSKQLPDDTIGTISLEFNDWKTREKASKVISEMLKATEDISGVIIEINEERSGPVSGKPIQMNIFGRNHEHVNKFTKKLKEAMDDKIGGFRNINDSLPIPGVEWHLEIDRELAAKYLLSTSDVGSVVQMSTNGLKISTCRLDDLDYEVDIIVRFPVGERLVSKLDSMRIINPEGDIIPINKFVTQIPHNKLDKIKRVDKEDVVTLDADVDQGIIVNNKIQEIRGWLDSNIQEGIKVVFKGDTKDQQDTAVFLRNAFLFVLAMTFLIMLTQFNNFYDAGVVMSAVFLSITGVLLGLLVTGRPFGIVMCGIGIMALAGIVLNNNILMVDTFHFLMKHGFTAKEAIIRAGAQRIRPILLTASAAVLGLIPMATSTTLDFMHRSVTYGAPSTQWWTQLATTICGGLTFATVLTLFFTPCLLAMKYCKK
jgi:multidrug efflux pump